MPVCALAHLPEKCRLGVESPRGCSLGGPELPVEGTLACTPGLQCKLRCLQVGWQRSRADALVAHEALVVCQGVVCP